MKNKWDERYGKSTYIYGKQPKAYLKEKLADLTPGRILFPAEGEGRNAVYAAEKNWEVVGFDFSKEGKKKAKALAKEKDVEITYQVFKAEDFESEENSFDAMALTYAHFAEKRSVIHKRLSAFVKPGGYLILEAFNKKHLENQKVNPQAGGPKNIEMLYDLEEIKQDFKGFEFKEALNAETVLKEGENHLGKAAVVRLFGIKK